MCDNQTFLKYSSSTACCSQHFQPVREISKWLRAHPKSSGSKTPKKKSEDSVGTAVPQKNPAEKLAQLAVALTASAGDLSRNARYCVNALC
jgi:hypothetical protein